MFQTPLALKTGMHLALSFPDSWATDRHELWYYGVGALLFFFCGVVSGYFIWRRAHLQYGELRHEKECAATALEEFQKEIESEKYLLRDSARNGYPTLSPPEERAEKPEPEEKEEPLPMKKTAKVATAVSPPVIAMKNPVAQGIEKDSPPGKKKARSAKKKNRSDDKLFF